MSLFKDRRYLKGRSWADAWKGHILLLESREEKPSPEKYRQALKYLKKRGAFRETGLKKVYCSYNSYAYKYFKEKDVKIITENKKIDTTNNTRKTKIYGGKRRLNHKKLNITLGFSKKLKLYNAKG